MRRRLWPRRPLALLTLPLAGLLAATALPSVAHGAGPGSGSYPGSIGTWAAAPTGVPASDTTSFDDRTVRQIVHTSVAGRTVRVRFTNEFGAAPLAIGEAHVAHRAP